MRNKPINKKARPQFWKICHNNPCVPYDWKLSTILLKSIIYKHLK